MKLPTVRRPHVDPRHAVEVLAYWFYGIAAVGSSIGQIWAVAAAPVWPDTIDVWIRIAAVAPFAIVIDLAGVVTSAFADTRRGLGEAAYGWRALSLFSVAVAVGINIAGHLDAIQYAVAFGFLGVLAYTIWLLHSAARRRDALRAAGKLAGTAPVYGPWQWITEFQATRLARQLALSQGLGLYESLQAAREHLRIRTRNQAFANRIETLVRAMHNDPIRAEIAVTGMNLGDIAESTADLIDNNAWAAYIARDLNPPSHGDTSALLPATQETKSDALIEDRRLNGDEDDEGGPASEAPQWTEDGARTLQRVPVIQADYERWRELWSEMNQTGATNRELAEKLGMNIRTLQHIRKAGTLGLLDSDEPPSRITTQAELLSANMNSAKGPGSRIDAR